MKKIKYLLCLAIAIIGLSAAPITASYAAEKVNLDTAKTVTEKGACEQQNNKKGCGDGGSLGNIFATVANIILFLVGAVAVIMLIIGGFRYVTSNGDANATAGAKNTILYAIIGIVVAFLAYAAVNFVVTSLTK
jgi:hypothetical protein